MWSKGLKSRFRQFTCGKMSQSWTVKTTLNFKISWEKNLKMATYKIDLTLGYKTFFSWRAGSGLHNGTWAFIDILVEGSTHHQYVARYRICGKSFSAKLRGMKLFTKQETMLWGIDVFRSYLGKSPICRFVTTKSNKTKNFITTFFQNVQIFKIKIDQY